MYRNAVHMNHNSVRIAAHPRFPRDRGRFLHAPDNWKHLQTHPKDPLMTDSPAAETAADRQGIQVISRAAAMLRALEAHPDGMSLGELAREVDLARSTVQRIVDALHREGLVMAASAASGVRLGPALLALASATRFHIGEVARETLELLAKQSGETVDLSLADQDKVVFIDQISGKHRLTAVSAVGVSFSLHATANGKAVLAAMPDAEIAKLRKRLQLSAITPNTITSWERLEQEIEQVRRHGIATDNEENSLGISAVSMAITSPSGEIAAISIPAPTHRFQANHAKLEKLLRKHVSELQRKLNP